MTFLTKLGMLWKVCCPFKLERGKILNTILNTQYKLRFSQFVQTFSRSWSWEALPKCVCHQRIRGKFKVKKAAVCCSRKEGLSCPKLLAAHVRTVFLRYCAYLVYQKDLSLCYIITQRCHSGLFILFFKTDFILDTSINFPVVAFPLQAKASQFQY